MQLQFDGTWESIEENAVIYKNAQGEYHRTDGPAVIYEDPNSHKQIRIWYQNGKLHRVGGEAMEGLPWDSHAYYWRGHRIGWPFAKLYLFFFRARQRK